jgi:kynurenine formamidase
MTPGTTDAQSTSEVGALDYITDADRAGAAALVRTGQVFTLGLPLLHPDGDPVSPDRPRAQHVRYRDWGDYLSGRLEPLDSGVASVDDGVQLACHGTTHVDALGHIIVDGQLWGGHPALEAVGGLRWASVAALGERGIFARAVLADVAGHLGVDRLEPTHHVTFAQLQATLAAQEVQVGRGDILLVRTGSLTRFYEAGYQAFFDNYSEPGLSSEPELIEWFASQQLSGLGSDTLSNELPAAPVTGEGYPLHRYLLHDLGVIFHEALWLEELAAACARDRRWDGLYVCGPLKLMGASGSPVNPIFAR